MPWTATLTKELAPDQTRVLRITYSDGSRSLFERFDFRSDTDLAYIQRRARDKIAALDAQDALYAALSDGPITPASPDPPPPTPTQAELDREAWLVKYRRWVKVKTTLIDTEILIGNEAPVVNLKAEVQSGLLPSYLPYL